MTAAVVCLGTAISLVTPARAGNLYATASTASYDSDPYDYSGGTENPPTTDQLIGTFTFTPVTLSNLGSITVSGTFGNGDSPSTALSDYYLGFMGDEEAVSLVQCDDYAADCASSSDSPTSWTVTLTQSEIETLAPALETGSIDFSYTWDSSPPAEAMPISPDLLPYYNPDGDGDYPQYVYAGAATIDVYTPEPATVFFCFSGIAGIFALRRFRKS